MNKPVTRKEEKKIKDTLDKIIRTAYAAGFKAGFEAGTKAVNG